MGTSLLFPTFRVILFGLALMATLACARQIVRVTPTTDMINYISELFGKILLWSEDEEQHRKIVDNEEIAGDVWYLYNKGPDFELYFTYIKNESIENFSVYCVTEWGSGFLKANFNNSAFVSGSFNDRIFATGKDTMIQAELGTMMRSIRSLTSSYSPLSYAGIKE